MSVWTKACKCASVSLRDGHPTASGPRVVCSTRYDEEKRAIIVTATLVWIACDWCDMPWTVVPDEEPAMSECSPANNSAAQKDPRNFGPN